MSGFVPPSPLLCFCYFRTQNSQTMRLVRNPVRLKAKRIEVDFETPLFLFFIILVCHCNCTSRVGRLPLANTFVHSITTLKCNLLKKRF